MPLDLQIDTRLFLFDILSNIQNLLCSCVCNRITFHFGIATIASYQKTFHFPPITDASNGSIPWDLSPLVSNTPQKRNRLG